MAQNFGLCDNDTIYKKDKITRWVITFEPQTKVNYPFNHKRCFLGIKMYSIWGLTGLREGDVYHITIDPHYDCGSELYNDEFKKCDVLRTIMFSKKDHVGEIEQNCYEKTDIDMHFCDFTITSEMYPKIRNKEGVIIDSYTKMVIVFELIFT